MQERMTRELEKKEKELIAKYEKKWEEEKGKSEFKKFATRVISRAEKDKVEEEIVDKLPEEKEKYLKELKEKEKIEPWIGKKMRTKQSRFDENVVGRGIRNEYTISPDRRQGCSYKYKDSSNENRDKYYKRGGYADEKERKDKKKTKPNTAEMGNLRAVLYAKFGDNIQLEDEQNNGE
uniref:Uncharacterized protein n=1 Tax=Meloidogyne javanica TaxID=6303 RepID=A0A915M5S4_MELJA